MRMPTRAILLSAALAVTLGAAPAALRAQLEPLPWEALGPNGGVCGR